VSDETTWEWKLLSMDPFGVVFAQVKEVPGAGRHFLVRHLCGVRGKSPEGKWLVGPQHLPVLELARGEFKVYPQSLHWMVDTLPGNVENLDAMFREVKVATPDQVKAEEQKVNRLKVLEGRNGGQ
jgi:hypothetical protein